MDNLKTGNLLTDWGIDRIADTVHYKPGTREIQTGFWEGILGGAAGLDVGAIKRSRTKQINNTAALDYLDETGNTLEGLGLKDTGGLTEATIKSAIKRKAEAKKTAELEKLRQWKVQDRDAASSDAAKSLAAQLEAARIQSDTTLQSQQNQYAHQSQQNHADRMFQRRENTLNRRHERELGDSKDHLQMQIAMMQSDLADKRMAYDRETQRMDRRDRMIAQLMQGIGQLGGVFTL